MSQAAGGGVDMEALGMRSMHGGVNEGKETAGQHGCGSGALGSVPWFSAKVSILGYPCPSFRRDFRQPMSSRAKLG
jgi:hypothetical protein